jgi:hypothetical protein
MEARMSNDRMVKATLAVGVLNAMVRSGQVRLGTNASTNDQQAHRRMFADVAESTDMLYAALFPEKETPEVEVQIGVKANDVKVGR